MTTIFILASVIVTIILGMGIFQKVKEKEAERKRRFLEQQQRNIKFIEDIIDEAKCLPLSATTIVIMLLRIHTFQKKMIECLPLNPTYRMRATNTSLEIQALKSQKSESELPKPISEMDSILMIKILRRVRTVLCLELQEQNTLSEDINKEIEKLDFMTTYLTANNLIALAEKSYASDQKGTARDRYESALNILNKASENRERHWVEGRIAHCKQQLEKISFEMKAWLNGEGEDDFESAIDTAQSTTPVVTQTKETTPVVVPKVVPKPVPKVTAIPSTCDDGLDAMLDGTKRKIAFI